MINDLKLSNYVKLGVLVPETHADQIREVMGRAGAGRSKHYSFGSFSVKGISRFRPEKGADPYIGEEGVLEQVAEERIETICSLECLERVLREIKQAHPYEETVIDIYPIYDMAYKK